LKTISIPVNNRPDLLARCLASIRACPTWREWRIVFSCEPTSNVAIEHQLITTPNAHISRNSVKLGCWSNTFLACEIAHALGSDFNLYLEDDLIISSDTLALCDYFADNAAGVLCLRTPESRASDKPSTLMDIRGGLFGDGFAYHGNQWPSIRAGWFAATDNKHLMWDWCLERFLSENAQWRPLVSRSQNIGLHGTHAAGEYDPNRHSPCYSGTPVTKFVFSE